MSSLSALALIIQIFVFMNTDPFVLNPLLASIRKDFLKAELTEDTLSADPVVQFDTWLKEAFAGGNEIANAMVLSTVDANSMPSSRVMLLRDVSFGGFTFFTNYHSQKADDLRLNSNASILFFWSEMERQVKIQGTIKKLPEKESDVYFASRPFESKVGAWTSKQSRVIKSRKELDKKYSEELKQYAGREVPRPPYWGGYVLEPCNFEFWQGRANRLHDRIEFTLTEKKQWVMKRLMP